MRKLETLWDFKTARFRVLVNAVEDDITDLSWDEDGSVKAGLDSGKLVKFGVVCTVYLVGREVGSDSIWGCVYESYSAFVDHRGIKAHSPKSGSYFSDVVREAIADARRVVTSFKLVHLREVL